MKGKLLLIIYFGIPIYVASKNGSTFAFAFGLCALGVILYFVNIFLIQHYISRHSPTAFLTNTWEQTAGKNIVPRWVSQIGLAAVAFIPSGLIIAALIYFGAIANKG